MLTFIKTSSFLLLCRFFSFLALRRPPPAKTLIYHAFITAGKTSLLTASAAVFAPVGTSMRTHTVQFATFVCCSQHRFNPASTPNWAPAATTRTHYSTGMFSWPYGGMGASKTFVISTPVCSLLPSRQTTTTPLRLENLVRPTHSTTYPGSVRQAVTRTIHRSLKFGVCGSEKNHVQIIHSTW